MDLLALPNGLQTLGVRGGDNIVSMNPTFAHQQMARGTRADDMSGSYSHRSYNQLEINEIKSIT